MFISIGYLYLTTNLKSNRYDSFLSTFSNSILDIFDPVSYDVAIYEFPSNSLPPS